MTAPSSDGELNHHAFPVNPRRESFFLEDFADANNRARDTPLDSPNPDPEQLRQADHARTVDILRRLGFPVLAPADLADAARLRNDTLQRQADPATRHYLNEALRRLRHAAAEDRPDDPAGGRSG